MPQMKMRRALALAIFCALLVLAACSSPNRQVSFNAATGKHADTWYADHGALYLQNTQTCVRCHGADLLGGISGVSCSSSAFAGLACHSHSTGFAAPDSHGASAKSAPTTTSGFSYCQACHGNGLTGGFALQTCLNTAGCHGVGVMAPHSPKPWRGNIRTHTTTAPGNAAACAQCHSNRANTSLVPMAIAAPGAPGCFNSTLCHAVVEGCSSCHDSPPQTGTHLVHFNSAPTDTLAYGDTAISSTVDAYRFGCGTCHPLDSSKHQNGTVDVELYSLNTPTGSIKAKNPSTASYTPGTSISTDTFHTGSSILYSNGTCDNVYCHSGKAVSSGPVGTPLIGSNGLPSLDANGNLTYAAYTVTISRLYKATPAWGTNSTGANSTFGACTECHPFPLTTYDPLSAPSSTYSMVYAGVGDSHQWVDSAGYGNLHAWNKGSQGFAPLSCRTCHANTVTQPNTWSRNSSDVTTYDPVPLADRTYHVTGSPVVKFDTGTAYSTTFDLSGAAYDPGTQQCSNVSCHLSQTTAVWGSPYRYGDQNECNVCHRH